MIGGYDSARDTTCLREFRANLYSLVSAQPARGCTWYKYKKLVRSHSSPDIAIRAQELRNAWLAESRIEKVDAWYKVKKTTCARYLLLGKEES